LVDNNGRWRKSENCVECLGTLSPFQGAALEATKRAREEATTTPKLSLPRPDGSTPPLYRAGLLAASRGTSRRTSRLRSTTNSLVWPTAFRASGARTQRQRRAVGDAAFHGLAVSLALEAGGRITLGVESSHQTTRALVR